MHSESGHCSRTFNLKGAWYHCAEAIVNNVITIQCHEETVDNVRTKIVKQKIKREAAIIHQRNMQIKRLQFKVKKLEAKRVSEDPRTDRLWRSNAQLWRKLAYLKEKTDQKPRLSQSADLSSLKDKVSYLEKGNATLSEYIEQLSNEKISAKVDGKTYSDALRRAIYLCVSNLAIWAISVVCDASARAFLKCIKGHSGYSGCDKCTQPGVYNSKKTFLEVDAPIRTNVAFDEMEDAEHHKGPRILFTT